MCILKRSIISFVIITLLVGMFSGCSASNGLKAQPTITATKEVGTQENKVGPILESNLEPGVYFEGVVNYEEWGFGMEDIAIDSKILTNLSYEDVLSIYGKPIKIETYKIPLLSAGEDVYRYFSVVVYDKIEFEFYSEEAPMNAKIPRDDKVFRFDLTQTGLPLDCGLEVGMTVEKVVEMFGQRKIYNIREEESIKHALGNNKPDEYYSEYSQAMTILCDTEKFEETPLSMSLVLLVKDDRVARIVFAYPTLD